MHPPRKTSNLLGKQNERARCTLMSTDGPDNNVIKIKPPLVFSKQNANQELMFLLK